MEGRATEQDNAGGPDDFQVGLQEMAVGVDLFGTDENLQIADQMADDEKKHHAAGAGHHVFLPHGGAEQVAQQVHHGHAKSINQ
jgi:hypothetical protein